MRTATKFSCGKRTEENFSLVATFALMLVLCTDLFVVSSAFLLKSEIQCLGLKSNPSTLGQNKSSFPSALCYGGLEDTESNFDSTLGSNFENPESPAQQPLPTSNDFMTPEEVVTTCMRYLQGKGEVTPTQERAGLEICYNFSSDSCRMANGGSLESFLQRANNPVFQTMVGCAQWEVVNVGPEIAGTPTRGAMQTILIDVVPRLAEGGAQRNDRQFLWTIVKERRPPRQGHCLVHECVAVENAFAHTL